MRKNFQLRNALMLMGLASMPLWFASCSDEENIPAPGTDEPTNPEIEAAFDFKMTTDLPVKIDYPSFAQVSVYDQLPSEGNSARLLFRSFTGANGKLQTVSTFPSAYIGKTVYVLSTGIDCPLWQEATLTENGLELKAEGSRLGVKTESPFSDNEMTIIRGGILEALPDNQDNREQFAQYTNGVNIDTRIKTNENYPKAHVSVTFVDAQGWNYNTLYYYTYKDGEQNNITEDWIRDNFVNDEHKLFGPYSTNDKRYDPNPHINETKELCNADGTPIDFVSGDRIGFVLKSQNGNDVNYYFTSQEAYEDRLGQSAVFTHENRALVYTFEDQPVYTWEEGWPYWPWWEEGHWEYNESDFNDFTFVVTTDPQQAIDHEDVPPLPIPPYYLQSTENPVTGTLLFEDNYPEAGDYDMNDFVVTYALRRVTYIHFDPNTGTSTPPLYLGAVDYAFTPKHDGAWYGCSFDFMLNDVHETPVHVYDLASNQTMGGLSEETITGTVDLGFTWERYGEGDATDCRPTGTRLDADAENHTIGAMFNPFITTNEKGYEIHLTKQKPSQNAKLDGLDEAALNYVLATDNKHPYAANIPTQNYQIVTEQMTIDQFYPDFTKWVESNKTTNEDWYMYPAQ